MPHSPPSTLSSSLDGVSRQQSSASDRTTKRGRKTTCSGPRTTVTYPYSAPNPCEELEVRHAALDATKVDARSLVAADDLIVRIFDEPRLRLHVLTVGKGSCERSRDEYKEFRKFFRATFSDKMTDAQLTAEVFTKRMQARGLVDMDEEVATAFSNLCLRYAQLKYHTNRVKLSHVVINNKIQSRIVATLDIPKGALILELGGVMSVDAISLDCPGSNKRKRKRQPQYNMFSVIWRGPGQCGPGPHADRLLLGPARFVNHSCKPNCRLKPFPKTTAWGIESLRDVLAGEEITVHYGERYFDPGECACAPCQTARKPNDIPKPSMSRNDYPTPPASEVEKTSRPRKRARTGR